MPYSFLMPDDLDRIREQAEQELDPDFRADAWFRPRVVTLDGDVLRFSPDEDKSRPLLPTRGLLRAFTGLKDADGAAVEGFAKGWGRLHLCAHGLPSSHHAFALKERGPVFPEPNEEDHDAFWADIFRSDAVSSDDYQPEPPEHPAQVVRAFSLGSRTAPRPEDIRDEGWATYEPVAAWQGIARRMSAILELALLMKIEDRTNVSLWGDAGGPLWAMIYERFGKREPELLAPFVRRLATQQLAIAAPRLVVGPEGLVVGGGLAQALAMQLALTVAGQRSDFLPCSEPNCGKFAEAPRFGATAYCEVHAKSSRNRDYQARFRERARSVDGVLERARELPTQLDELAADGKSATVEWDDFPAATVAKLRPWAAGVFRAAVAALRDPESAFAAEVQLRALLEVFAHLTWISQAAEPKSGPDDPASRALRIELGIVEERTNALAKSSDASLPEPRAIIAHDLEERKETLRRLLAVRGAPVKPRGYQDVAQTLRALPPEFRWMSDAWVAASMASHALVPDRSYRDAGNGVNVVLPVTSKERLAVLDRLLGIYTQCAAAILIADGSSERVPAFVARVDVIRRHQAFQAIRES